MPVHDWSRVVAGTFHAFHVSWMSEIQEALNNGVLPADYYALAEQIAGPMGPDVLTLQADGLNGGNGSNGAAGIGAGGLAVATLKPRVRFTAQTEMDQYAAKQRSIVIRHSSGDRIVALIEIVSPGNKSSKRAMQAFVEKAANALYHGYHLLIIDLHPPGPRDPQGIHGAIWSEIADDSYKAPADKSLTLVAYTAGTTKLAWIEPVAVGDALTEMPLFLDPETYVNVPLESTYQAAYRGVPQKWRRVLEA